MYACFFFLEGKSGNTSKYHKFSSVDGLSDNFITSIVEDHKGFIWTTTNFGINRFDGENFKTYTVSEFPSLMRNDFTCSVLDKNGNVLFGSYNGVVVRYNTQTHNFENKSITKTFGSNYVSLIGFYTDIETNMYALTTSGIFKFDYDSDAFTDEKIYNNTRHLRSQSLFIDSSKQLWIGANTGLHVFNSSCEEIAHYEFTESANAESIFLHRYNDSVLLIGTSNTGLWSVKINNNSQKINKPVQIKSPFEQINAFSVDSDSRLLIGTISKGLWYINGNLPKIEFDSFIPLVQDSKAIISVYEDENKNIWAGAHGTGLFCIPASNNSKIIHSSEFNFPSAIVSSFGKDNLGNIWVGSDGDGIFVLSPDFTIKNRLTANNKLSSSGVLSIAHDSEDAFWVATWGGGICKIDAKTMKSTCWTTWNSDLPLDNCKSIFVANDTAIWVATHGEGLACYNQAQNNWLSLKNGAPSSYSFAPDNWLNQIIVGKNGEKWIATIHRVWYMNGNTAKIILSDSLNKPMHLPLFVHDIALTSKGDIVVATNKGIYRIDSNSMQAEILEFMPSEEFVSIAVDRENRCWVASNNHIFSIDCESKTYKEISISGHSISANYFMPRAIFIDSSNYIFFGAVDGFLTFHPDSLGQSSTIKTLEFRDIYISSKKMGADNDLLGNIKNGSTLTLPYNMTNNIRIEFDIVCTDNTQSSFIIEGLDNEWINLGKGRSIVVNKLSPGTYTLKLKTYVTNNYNEHKSISLHLIVAPPWWKTWWFIAFCIIVLIVVIVGIIKFRFRQIKLYNEKLEQEVLNRTDELKVANEEIILKNKTLGEKQALIENKNKELAQTISTKDRLMSIIAHDLKNPAFSIVSLLSLLKRDFKKLDDSEKTKFIETANNSAITLQNELLKMLEWGILQQKAFSYNPQNTSIISIITDTILFLKQIASDKSIEIRFNSENDYLVLADTQMVSIAFRNILNNAIKFTPRGGIIYISCMQNNSTVSVSVKDTGVGMTREQLKNVFISEEYSSTRGTENEKGTGLGLKIVKEFIEKNNGEIEIESEQGKGTCFTIKFPLAQENNHWQNTDIERTEDASKNSIQINNTLFEGSSILIIDDNKGVREYLRNILEQHCSVLEAENGEDGYLIAKENLPDIIVSDVDMPNMDGFSLSKKIQSTPETSHIPLILLTAKTENVDKITGLLSGAIDYITKPFNEEVLLLKLSNLLQIRQNIQKRVLIDRLQGNDVTANIDPFLDKLISIIEKHYCDPEFNVEKLADMMSISRSTLIRRTKVIIDKNPSEIIIEYRLETARKKIDSGRTNISEIAYESGFSDPRYFTRRFKQHYGKTPSDYKQ